jgi:hypothetical protein
VDGCGRAILLEPGGVLHLLAALLLRFCMSRPTDPALRTRFSVEKHQGARL